MEGFNWSILGWIAGLVFVYIFGLYEGRSQGRKKRIEEEAQEKKEQKPPAPVKVDDPGLLRIKNENGIMSLDLDGERVSATSLNAEQRKRLIEMLNVIRPWLEGKPASVPAPTGPPPPKQTPAADVRQSAPAPAPSQPTPAAQSMPSTPIKKKDAEPEEPAPTSIVGQINRILQKNIVNTPLASRGVSMMESVTGGVNVYIGVQHYEGLDAVPDEEVKAAIRAAITEWENTYTPGM